MLAPIDLCRTVPKRPRKNVNTFESGSVKLHQDALPKPKPALRVLRGGADYRGCENRLLDLVLRFPPCLFGRISNELDLFGKGVSFSHRRQVPTQASVQYQHGRSWLMKV